MTDWMIRAMVPMLIISALFNLGSGVLNILMEHYKKAGLHIIFSIAIVLLCWPVTAMARDLLPDVRNQGK